MTSRPSVLFVCIHNAGRSQMAAGFLRSLGGGAIEVRSAGSDPGSPESGTRTGCSTIRPARVSIRCVPFATRSNAACGGCSRRSLPGQTDHLIVNR